MEPWLQSLITVVCAVVASSGFWAMLTNWQNKRAAKKNKDPDGSCSGSYHFAIITLY